MQRDAWIYKSRNLRDVAKDVSISPDLPPVLRKMKPEPMNIRKDLPREDKKLARVMYMKSWPFVKLTFKDNARHTQIPSVSK
jgi:hypothetical protein